MRLHELAEELGKDPLEVMTLLLRAPRSFFVGSSGRDDVDDWMPPTYDIYSIKIHSHLVQEAREFILKSTAQEVIDHVKDRGTQGIGIFQGRDVEQLNEDGTVAILKKETDSDFDGPGDD